MIAGAPIMMLGSALIFLPPDNVDGWYLMMATMTIYLGASMLGLAYSAWGAEVVQSYHGRARLALNVIDDTGARLAETVLTPGDGWTEVVFPFTPRAGARFLGVQLVKAKDETPVVFEIRGVEITPC